MRSRFTAYAHRNEAYLLSTWETSKKPDGIDFSKEHAEWYRLEILNVRKGQKSDHKGLVEFKAYFLHDKEEHFMHELSRFKKTAGRWYYLDGLVKSTGKVKSQTNLGRNAPCLCGSGKKFKRCCGQ